MLTVLLTILKIIGIILLCILGLLLLLICLVLFVPIHYRAKGFYGPEDKKYALDARVHYLLHIVSVRFCLDSENGSKLKIRIFGIPLGNKNHKEKKSKKEKKNKKTGGTLVSESADAVELTDANMSETRQEELTQENVTEPVLEAAYGTATEPVTESVTETATVTEEAPVREKKKLSEKIRYTFTSICDKIKAIVEKGKTVTDKVTYYKNILEKDSTSRGISKVKRTLFSILKAIRPRKLKGRVRFGLEDPATTGQVLGYVSTLYALYYGHLEIIPEFDEKVIDIRLKLGGHILLFTLVRLLLKLWFDKDFARTLHDFRS